MPNGNHPPDYDAFPPDTRPYLCVPYWTTPVSGTSTWDTGQVRPLPAAVVSYASDSIATSPYTPGEPLDVTVTVRNSGGGNSAAMVTVVVYWADPTVGFAKPNFFAATAVPVPPSRTAPGATQTPTMTATIPASAPTHVCLLVAVSHPQDRAGTVCDPINDRHWAQHNLQAVNAAPGAPALIPFMAANPFNVEKTLILQIGPVDERRLRQVADVFHAQATDIHPRIRLLDVDGAVVAEDGVRTRMALRLGPLAQRPLQMLMELGSDIPVGRCAAVEAGLFDGDDEGRLVGSLGVVLLPPEPE